MDAHDVLVERLSETMPSIEKRIVILQKDRIGKGEYKDEDFKEDSSISSKDDQRDITDVLTDHMLSIIKYVS